MITQAIGAGSIFPSRKACFWVEQADGLEAEVCEDGEVIVWRDDQRNVWLPTREATSSLEEGVPSPQPGDCVSRCRPAAWHLHAAQGGAAHEGSSAAERAARARHPSKGWLASCRGRWSCRRAHSRGDEPRDGHVCADRPPSWRPGSSHTRRSPRSRRSSLRTSTGRRILQLHPRIGGSRLGAATFHTVAVTSPPPQGAPSMPAYFPDDPGLRAAAPGVLPTAATDLLRAAARARWSACRRVRRST